MKKQSVSLAQIRQAIATADAERTRKSLSAEERKVLEQTCVTLRDAERKAIVDTETGLIKGFTESAGSVNLQARKLREMVIRMNKVPKVLDTTETVIKECAKVLKAIATWTLCLVIMSCSTLSKSQLKRINDFATVQDSIKPAAIFQTLDNVRMERSLIYAASLTDTESRIHELNALSHVDYDKADVCYKILASYARALKSLSADTRWKQYGTELRGIGRNIDSLAIVTEQWEPGLAKSLGKTSGYLTEQYMKRRQRKLVYNMLQSGDTLVASCCDALIAGFKSTEFVGLIDNEKQALESDYRAYLNAMAALERVPDTDFDRIYVEQKQMIEKAKKLRKKNITMLQSLKRAHAALVKEMDKSRTCSEFSEELFELNKQVRDVVELHK